MQSAAKNIDHAIIGSPTCLIPKASRPAVKFEQILIPLDLKHDCSASICYAIRLAKIFGATINLLHLYEEPYVLTHSPRSRNCDVFKQQRQKVFAEFYNLLRKTRSEFSKSVGFFEYGNPDHDIGKIARKLGADLLILCSHNATWFEHRVFGSHTERILESASCPVLIVREKEFNPPGAKLRDVEK